ncbi:MAG: OmpH family outer membrane protein [Opitutales bacterium]
MLKKISLIAMGVISASLNTMGDDQKIYAVDLSEVYEHFYKTKSAQENFQLLVKQSQEGLEKLMQEGKLLFDEREILVKKRENPANSKEINEKLEKELANLDEKINKKGEEINMYRAENERKLGEKRQAVMDEHFKEIQAGIEVLAKDKEADIIVNKAAMGVLYAKPKYDLTQDVIEVVNKAAPKTNKK